MKRQYFYVLLFFILDEAISVQKPRTTWDITWDPRFTPDLDFGKTHSIPDVRMGDYMEIYCPQYDADEADTLTFIIYNVSHKSFTECTIPEDAKKIFSCNRPSISMKLTTKFQKRSPNPLGFTFRPGHTYYYMALPIEKSTEGNDPCSRVMRLSIHVHPKLVHNHRPPTPKTSLPKTSTSTSTTSTTTTTTKTSTKPKSLLTRIANSSSDKGGTAEEQSGGFACSHHKSSMMMIVMSIIVSWLMQR